MMKEYTIREAVKELSISKATLYNRISKFKPRLDGHISTKNGRTYISIEGLEILKSGECLDDNLDNLDDNLDNLDCNLDNLDTPESEQKTDIDTLGLLKSENEFLRNQLLKKDNQIQEKDNQIQNLLRLNENSQILLKQQQDKILLLEDNTKKSFWSFFKWKNKFIN